MKRRPLFAANWKMNKTPSEAREYVASFWGAAEALVSRADIVLCAPFVDLETLRGELSPSSVQYGAQDCYWEPKGPFTGEISAAMLKDVGASYCIVGHSERRRLFGETDEMVARKTAALVRHEITPIVCVGETLEERNARQTVDVVSTQIRTALSGLSEKQRAAVVVAYEPVWAIGTGVADDPTVANETMKVIRGLLDGLADARLLYGGSMNPDNAFACCKQPEIDGGLVGTASLDPRQFLAVIMNSLKAM